MRVAAISFVAAKFMFVGTALSMLISNTLTIFSLSLYGALVLLSIVLSLWEGLATKKNSKMSLGLDFHDTISYDPKFFVNLIKSWPGDVYIITGTPPSKLYEVEEALNELGLGSTHYKTILGGYEYDKSQMGLSHFKKMARHKLKLLQKHNIEVYFDDNPFYVSYIKDHGISTFQPIVSRDYLEEFEEADPFFTCNLQKMQFDYLESLEDCELLKKNNA
jgi:hypothetical protein|tara:strand:+ start:3634 stop:4290 length:657 start_codon:yes stop_codon:yes gene_type:complete